jgi:hypothetical protein
VSFSQSVMLTRPFCYLLLSHKQKNETYKQTTPPPPTHTHTHLPTLTHSLTHSPTCTHRYVVAGLWSTLYRAEGSVVRNEFGQLFQRAGEKTGARIRMGAFDSSILEIKSDDMSTFIASLAPLTA